MIMDMCIDLSLDSLAFLFRLLLEKNDFVPIFSSADGIFRMPYVFTLHFIRNYMNDLQSLTTTPKLGDVFASDACDDTYMRCVAEEKLMRLQKHVRDFDELNPQYGLIRYLALVDEDYFDAVDDLDIENIDYFITVG